jgi:alkanesulfonate monooxygenase SsuD/methylene tetrahydromethanopterin reductase-like flavin-dependent oxidoreductase (luciferase family)
MAARRGLGVLGFSVGTIDELAPVLEAYKRAIPNADPIGAFVNDNVMVTSAAYVAEDAEEALRSFVDSRPMYLSSNVYRYHDTFPHPPEIPSWPELIPDPDLETARLALGAPGMVLGTPDDALKACRDWEAAGADQLVFGIGPAPLEETLRTIRLMGEHVIPKIDRDPVHRTTRFREAAAASGG